MDQHYYGSALLDELRAACFFELRMTHRSAHHFNDMALIKGE